MACQWVRSEWFPRGESDFKIQSSLLKGENKTHLLLHRGSKKECWHAQFLNHRQVDCKTKWRVKVKRRRFAVLYRVMAVRKLALGWLETSCSLWGWSLQLLISNHFEKEVEICQTLKPLSPRWSIICHSIRKKSAPAITQRLKKLVEEEAEIQIVSHFKIFSSYCKFSWLESWQKMWNLKSPSKVFRNSTKM